MSKINFGNNTNVEGFNSKESSSSSKSKGTFVTKRGNDIYDDFYVSVYDDLLHNEAKDKFEIDNIDFGVGPVDDVDVGFVELRIYS